MVSVNQVMHGSRTFQICREAYPAGKVLLVFNDDTSEVSELLESTVDQFQFFLVVALDHSDASGDA